MNQSLLSRPYQCINGAKSIGNYSLDATSGDYRSKEDALPLGHPRHLRRFGCVSGKATFLE